MNSAKELENGSEDFTLFTLGTQLAPRLLITVSVGQVPICMEVDTGAASCFIVSKRTWQENWNTRLQPPSLSLTTYSNVWLKTLGQTTVSVNYNGQEAELPLIVVNGNGPSLFGRNWLQAIQLDWASLKVTRVEALSTSCWKKIRISSSRK